MRVVVTGASGNVGTSVVRAMEDDPAIESITGIARRVPALRPPKVEWVGADVRESDLVPLFRGADAVIHLAWLIQPSRNRDATREANVSGSRRVFEAVAEAEVPALVYASSVGAYSRGPKDRVVDESWPTEGIESSFYSRDKADVERLLDGFQDEHPAVRVVRLRPALIFKREAATEIRRLFLGPLLPKLAFDRRFIPIVPRMPGLRFQVVHSHDVGEAYRLAATREVEGAFNIAADPPLDAERLAGLLGARPVPLPAPGLRALATMSWRLRLQPTPPGWLDMGLTTPIMKTDRARTELGWEPRHSAEEALLDLLDGLRDGAGIETPPLDPATSGPLRINELRGGIGARA